VLKLGRLALIAACPAILGGCEANQLYLAYHSNVGINASVDDKLTQGHLIVGYNRDFIAVVPKSVPMDGSPDRRDAMATLVCSDLVVDGVFLKKYSENIATGEAAKIFSKRLMDSKGQSDNFFDCYKKTAVATAGGTK